MNKRKRDFKWYQRDIELLDYLNKHPYFSIPYESSSIPLHERDDFKKLCNKAGEDLSRLKNKLLHRVNGIILKYAKLNLLVSCRQVSRVDILKHRDTKEYFKGRLNFLQVFISGFTYSDIPQSIHDYYDNLFDVNNLTGEKKELPPPLPYSPFYHATITGNYSAFKWRPKDLELFEYFKDHPYFSVKYERTDVCLDQGEDFTAICKQASKDLNRLECRIKQKMSNVIVKYAKLKLLISHGKVKEAEVRNHRCTAAYVKGKIDFLNVFVSGFTDDDIPKVIHDYYDNLFKVIAFAIEKAEITIDEIQMYMNRTERGNENELNLTDTIYINNIIKQSFQSWCNGVLPSFETGIFKDMGFYIDKVHTDDDTDDIENGLPDTVVEDPFRNDIPTNTFEAVSQKFTFSASPKISIKTSNDSDIDIVEHDVLDEVLNNGNIKRKINGINGRGVSDVEDSLINAIPNITNGVDLNKYMKDIADFLCERLPIDKRRDFLNQVQLIVSKIMQG